MRPRVLAPIGILALATAPFALADRHTSGPTKIPVGGKIHVTCGGYASKNPHPDDLSIEWTSNTDAVTTEVASADGAVDPTYTGAHGDCTDSAGKPGPFIATAPGLYHVTVTTVRSEGKCTQTCSIDSTSSHHTVTDVEVVEPCDGGLFSGVQTDKGVPLTDDQLDSTGIGQGLYPGQQVSTGDLAVELDMENGGVIRLGPGSHFTVPPDCTSQDPTQSAFQLFAGTIWASVVDALGGQPEVRGESAVTGVRGSIFTASISGGKLYYHVVEGRGFYTTSSGASSKDVPAGTTLVFTNGKLVQTSTSASAWPASQQQLANLKLKPLRTGNPPGPRDSGSRCADHGHDPFLDAAVVGRCDPVCPDEPAALSGPRVARELLGCIERSHRLHARERHAHDRREHGDRVQVGLRRPRLRREEHGERARGRTRVHKARDLRRDARRHDGEGPDDGPREGQGRLRLNATEGAGRDCRGSRGPFPSRPQCGRTVTPPTMSIPFTK